LSNHILLLSNILSKNPTNGQNKVPGECWFHHSYCRQRQLPNIISYRITPNDKWFANVVMYT